MSADPRLSSAPPRPPGASTRRPARVAPGGADSAAAWAKARAVACAAADAAAYAEARVVACAVLCAVLCAVTCLPAPALAALNILPLDQVHPGMIGTGRSVFSGGRIEEFGVEVVDVVRGQRPKGGLILFRGTGEVLQHAGIIAGMSGSPVYFDGKLAGAIAFAYPFLKDPIGAITPIEEMIELDRYPLPGAADVESMESGPAGAATGGDRPAGASGTVGERVSSDPSSLGDDPSASTRADAQADKFAPLWAAFTHRGDRQAGTRPETIRSLPAEPTIAALTAAPAPGTPDGLRPLPIPLSFSGWSPSLLEAARGPASAAGFLPVESAQPALGEDGAGDDGERSGADIAPLEPGSAIALELVGGDATLAAIGTVTAVDGLRVYAFGHPMIQGGPVAFPMFAARIHTVMPSLQISSKMGSPTRPIGGVWQDRRCGVLGLLGEVPPTIPVRVRISLPGREAEVYRYRVVRDPMLTPMLLPWTISNSYQHAGWLQGETTARAQVEVHFDGGHSVGRRDLVVTDSPATGLGGDVVLPASLLLTNPFRRVKLDSLSVEVTAEPGHASAEVVRVQCDPRRAKPGDTLRVAVTLRPWRGPDVVRTSQFVVPSGWAGKRLRVTAAGVGAMLEWDRDRAPGKWSPQNLDDLLRMVSTLPPSGSLLLRVSSAETGAVVRGRELPGLPGSLLAAGRESGDAASIRPANGTVLEERTLDTPWDITGREAAEVEIAR